MFDPRDLASDPRTRPEVRPRRDHAREREKRERDGHRREYDPRRTKRQSFQDRTDRAIADVGMYRNVAYRDLAEAHFEGHPYAARDELQVDRVVLRIQAKPQQPHGATADFDLVRMEMANEVGRERWTLSLQFLFLEEIPPDLIVHNPMGIVITYLQGDRATVTGDQ